MKKMITKEVARQKENSEPPLKEESIRQHQRPMMKFQFLKILPNIVSTSLVSEKMRSDFSARRKGVTHLWKNL